MKVNKYIDLLYFLTLAILGFSIYGHTLHYDFINWDDNAYIVDNMNIRNFSLQNIFHIFTTFIVGEWFPLQVLTYVIDYSFWGLNPVGYHLGNIFLHIMNAFLVSLLVRRLCSDDFRIGLLTGLFFLVHPVQVESVVWISQRKTVLCTLFFLLSFLCYIQWRMEGATRLYYASIVFYIFSLLSKVNSLTLPAILLTWECTLKPYMKSTPAAPDNGANRGMQRILSILTPLVPFGLISVGITAVFLYGQISEKVIRELYGGTPYTHFLTSIAGWVLKYPNRIPLPMSLSVYYPRVDEYYSLFTAPYLLAVPAWMLSLTFWLRKFRYDISVFFLMLFFTIQLFPTSGIVPAPFGGADRHLYIYSIPVFALINMGLLWLAKYYFYPVFTAFIIILSLLSTMTIERCTVWKNSITLWEDVVSKSPDLAYARFKLAHAFMSVENFDNAIIQSRLSTSLDPTVAMYFYTQGLIYRYVKMYPDSLKSFSRADVLEPGNSVLHREIAVTYESMEEWENAIHEYTKSIDLDPGKAYLSMGYLGALYTRLKRYPEAVIQFERALKINPYYADAHRFLGALYISNFGRTREGVAHIRRSLELDPHQPNADFLMSIITQFPG